MGRPVKWARDLHRLRERAMRSRTETWGRSDIEALFGIGRATAQTLMKAIGEVQAFAGAHFVERPALLSFLEAMIAASSVEDALRARLDGAKTVRRPKSIQIVLPVELRHALLRHLPKNITLGPGRLEVRAETAVQMLESLLTLAMIMQNDLDSFRSTIEPAPALADQLRPLFAQMRRDIPDERPPSPISR